MEGEKLYMESFNLKVFDLEEILHQARREEKQVIFTTMDNNNGRLDDAGAIVKISGISADTMNPFTINQLWEYKDIFPKIKVIWFIKNKRKDLVADRRHYDSNLVTVTNGPYHRPKRKKSNDKKAV